METRCKCGHGNSTHQQYPLPPYCGIIECACQGYETEQPDTARDAAELLPCPFCGKEPFWVETRTTYFKIRCLCLIEKTGYTREEAVKTWNTRAEAGLAADRWHRVDDGLPTKDGEYITQHINGALNFSPFIADGNFDKWWKIHFIAWREIEPYNETDNP